MKYIVVFDSWCASAGPFDTMGDARVWIESLPLDRGSDGIIQRMDEPVALAEQWAEWDKEA